MPKRSGVPAFIPLSLLEALRNLDTPQDDGLAEIADEVVSKRFGLSNTVAAQIERYQEGVEDRQESVIAVGSGTQDPRLRHRNQGEPQEDDVRLHREQREQQEEGWATHGHVLGFRSPLVRSRTSSPAAGILAQRFSADEFRNSPVDGVTDLLTRAPFVGN